MKLSILGFSCVECSYRGQNCNNLAIYFGVSTNVPNFEYFHGTFEHNFYWLLQIEIIIIIIIKNHDAFSLANVASRIFFSAFLLTYVDLFRVSATL